MPRDAAETARTPVCGDLEPVARFQPHGCEQRVAVPGIHGELARSAYRGNRVVAAERAAGRTAAGRFPLDTKIVAAIIIGIQTVVDAYEKITRDRHRRRITLSYNESEARIVCSGAHTGVYNHAPQLQASRTQGTLGASHAVPVDLTAGRYTYGLASIEVQASVGIK